MHPRMQHRIVARLTVEWEFGIPGRVLSRPTGCQAFMGWDSHFRPIKWDGMRMGFSYSRKTKYLRPYPVPFKEWENPILCI